MGIFVNKNNDFTVDVYYVIDKKDEVHVLSKEDVESLKKSPEEKKKIVSDQEDDRQSEIPFNVPADLMKYEEKDIRKASVKFRKPAFDDMPVMMSSFTSGNFSNMSPGDLFEFNNRRLRLLFKKGEAQDGEGKPIKLDQNNISDLSPALGTAIALGMNEFMSMNN